MRTRSRVSTSLVIAGAVVVTAAFGALAEPQARRAAPSCAERGVTVTANERARVYRLDIERGLESRYYACLLPRGPSRPLGTFYSERGGPTGFRLAGRFLAFRHVACTQSNCARHLIVTNLRTNRTRRRMLQPSSVGVPALLVKSNGAIAWSERIGTFEAPVYEIRKLDGDGDVLLDSGSDIDPTSLASSGRLLYWSRGAEARSAPFR